MCTFAHILVMMFVLSLQSYQKGLTPQTGASPIFYFSRLACACIHVHARDVVFADNNNCFIWISMRLCGALIFTDLTVKKKVDRSIAPQPTRITKIYLLLKHNFYFLLFCCPSTSVPIPRNIIMRNTGRSLVKAVTDKLFVRLLLPLVRAQPYNLRFSIIII